MPSPIILDAIHILKMCRWLIGTNPRYSSHKRMYPFHKCKNRFSSDCRKCAYKYINSEIKRLESL